MTECNICGNYDDENDEDSIKSEKDKYQPNLYYYWAGPDLEDYDWRKAYPLVDCMCKICFDIADSEGKIIWTDLDFTNW